jgi:hypothetical protein
MKNSIEFDLVKSTLMRIHNNVVIISQQLTTFHNNFHNNFTSRRR